MASEILTKSNDYNIKYSLMTPNCSTALHLVLNALGICKKDEVIAPECTWIGSVACIKYQKAKTVFADIDFTNWCLSAENIEKNITSKTTAIIVVNLYGNMPDWDDILYLCRNKNIYVIEDAADRVNCIPRCPQNYLAD